VKTITIGKKHTMQSRITQKRWKSLLALSTLENALGKNDPLCKLLRGEQETSFTQQYCQKLLEQRDREIEEHRNVRKKLLAFVDELGNTDSIRPAGSNQDPGSNRRNPKTIRTV
jgi:hypothetical protein